MLGILILRPLKGGGLLIMGLHYLDLQYTENNGFVPKKVISRKATVAGIFRVQAGTFGPSIYLKNKYKSNSNNNNDHNKFYQ